MPARTRARLARDNTASGADDSTAEAGGSVPHMEEEAPIIGADDASVSGGDQGDGNDDDDSDAPEEQSNTASRQATRSAEGKRQAEAKRLAEARRKSTAARQQRNTEQQSVKKGKAAAPSSSRQSQLTAKDRVGDHLGDVDDKDSGKAAAAAATATDTPPQPVRVVERLDPALFAATFAARSSNQKGGGGRDDDDSHTLDSRSSSALEIAAERRRRERRRKGIVRGRDGQPMRRVDDTTIRVLPSIAQQHPSFLAQDGEGNETEAEETLVRPPALDPIEARPSSKNRAFKKRKLGLHGAQGNGGGGPASRAHVPKVSGGGGKSKASKRDEDDPLGLEDPAFMKGGEFEGMGLSGTKKTQRGPGGGSRNGLGKRHTELRRADAGRRTGAPALSRHGGAMHFVRSS